MPRIRGYLFWLASFVGCVMWQCIAAVPASAYEDQLTLGGGVGFAYSSHSALPSSGAALALESSFGLGQSLSLRGWLGLGLHPGHGPYDTFQRVGLGGEVLYLFDILQLVPYVGAGLDLLATTGSSGRADLGVHPVLGIDWLWSRELILGLGSRLIFVPTHAQRELLYLSVLFTAAWVLEL